MLGKKWGCGDRWVVHNLHLPLNISIHKKFSLNFTKPSYSQFPYSFPSFWFFCFTCSTSKGGLPLSHHHLSTYFPVLLLIHKLHILILHKWVRFSFFVIWSHNCTTQHRDLDSMTNLGGWLQSLMHCTTTHPLSVIEQKTNVSLYVVAVNITALPFRSDSAISGQTSKNFIWWGFKNKRFSVRLSFSSFFIFFMPMIDLFVCIIFWKIAVLPV